jgi:hypothetical protein
MLPRAHRNDAAVAYSPLYCNNNDSSSGQTQPKVYQTTCVPCRPEAVSRAEHLSRKQ